MEGGWLMTRFIAEPEPARRELSPDEYLELLIGPGRAHGSATPVSHFDSEEARRAAWVAHRDEVLEHYPETWAGERYDG